jgi:hypothetical protein
MSSRKTATSRGTDRLAQNALPQTRLESRFQYEIDPAPEQTLQAFLQAHVAIKGARRELDEKVEVAFIRGLVPRRGSEESQLAHLELLEVLAIRSQRRQDLLACHWTIIQDSSAGASRATMLPVITSVKKCLVDIATHVPHKRKNALQIKKKTRGGNPVDNPEQLS